MSVMEWIAALGLAFTVISTVYIAVSRAFSSHERLDQKRHEDNLGRFSTIDARLGVIETLVRRNGTSH